MITSSRPDIAAIPPEARVAAGVALLDTFGPPGWRDRINLITLDIEDKHSCILGQIYGDYDAGLYALTEPLKHPDYPDARTYATAARYGFDTLLGQDTDTNQLTNTWRQHLTQTPT